MLTTNFLYAGRAVFTIDNGRGDHYTFKVKRANFENTKQAQPFFVNVLSGGGEHYTYMGKVVDGKWQATHKSTFTESSTAVRVFNFASAIIHEARDLPTGYKIHHEGACGKCGRPLTDPISITTGLGPICRGTL